MLRQAAYAGVETRDQRRGPAVLVQMVCRRLAPGSAIRVPSSPCSFRQSEAGNDGAEELTQFSLQIRERRRLKGRWIPAQEAPPKAALLGDLCKRLCKAHRHLCRKCGLSPPKCSADRFKQARQVERKCSSCDPYIVKVLDPPVRFTEANHRLELFGDYGLRGVHQDLGGGQIRKQAREGLSFRWWVDVITIADVYPDGDDGLGEFAAETQLDSLVLVGFANRLDLQAGWIKNDAIVDGLDLADAAEECGDDRRIGVS